MGVLDLELFGRALQLRWLWFQWCDSDRPWAQLEVLCNEVDRQLFRLSTLVTLGNGAKAKFRDSPWLDGHAPQDVAPNQWLMIYKIPSRCGDCGV